MTGNPTSILDQPFDPLLVGYRLIDAANAEYLEGREYSLPFVCYQLEYVLMPANLKGIAEYYVLVCHAESRMYRKFQHWLPPLHTVRDYFAFLTGQDSPLDDGVYKQMLNSQYRKHILDEILKDL